MPSLIDKKPLPREGLMTNRKIADIVKDKKFLVLPDIRQCKKLVGACGSGATARCWYSITNSAWLESSPVATRFALSPKEERLKRRRCHKR